MDMKIKGFLLDRDFKWGGFLAIGWLTLVAAHAQEIAPPQELTTPEAVAETPAQKPASRDDLTELEDMVVTGTRTEKRLSDVAVRTEVIKREEIEMTASRTLVDACAYTPGIRVENKCQNCSFTEIRLLGMDGPYSMILVDGQPLLSAMAAVYGLEHIPARLIERIEVIKGGGSALYGPGAVAGVINVITKLPTESGADMEATYADVDGTTATSYGATADYVSTNGQSIITGFAQVDEREAYDRNDDGYSDIGKRESSTVGVNGRQFIGDEADVKVGYTHTEEDRRGGDRLSKPEYMANLAESADTTRDAASATWSHATSPSFDYRLTGAYAFTKRDTYYGGGMDPNAYGESENPLAVVDSQFNHYLDEHTVSWGPQYTWENIKDEQPGYNLSTDDTYDNVGTYLQDDWMINDQWNLITGGRLDKNSELDNVIFSPRSAVKWSPDDEVAMRASYARGFRAPQIFSEDLHIMMVGGTPSRIENASGLEEETSDTFTLGTEWTPAMGDGFGLVEVTPFYTMFDGKFAETYVGNVGGTDVYERYNASDAHLYGTEFNLGYQVPQLYEARLGWVLQRARFDEAEGDFGSKDFEYTPP
ncbi:MAG: hypothetical protein FJ220_02385, partial [Kiritimatiellaceae bacterium]|nr:hypothetical protein [Kiritimatiellaceae bacterium]